MFELFEIDESIERFVTSVSGVVLGAVAIIVLFELEEDKSFELAGMEESEGEQCV
jgi:hypothetical protein